MKRYYIASMLFAAAIAGLFVVRIDTASSLNPPFKAQDPGVRTSSAPSAGAPLPGMTTAQLALFAASQAEFSGPENVVDGLGPRMNLDSCVGCHIYPAPGGSSPPMNPQVAFATKMGADNTLPSFISLHGPVREARFVKNSDGSPDGGVHSLFTIQGRSDATGCTLAQPNFASALSTDNVIFRIPTPTFGAGLIEQIPDSTIMANQAANAATKKTLGIRGRPNIVLTGNAITGQPNNNGNDGTAARFGWKAQNKSLLMFAGEAYNVEMGITNELFQTERDETPGCVPASTPNDTVDGSATNATDAVSAIEKFAFFMRYLAPPTPSPTFPGGSTSINRGKSLFTTIGCAQCHTPALATGYSSIKALHKQTANLYSDLLIHDMGEGLADGISQGQAGPSEFRTAPLWGLGQRLFFLHDGRTSDLLVAIQQHSSGSTRNGDASEANTVVSNFNQLSEIDKQNLLNFLRSL
jgi:CxxC motif-containing protein (DUF1111 family)